MANAVVCGNRPERSRKPKTEEAIVVGWTEEGQKVKSVFPNPSARIAAELRHTFRQANGEQLSTVTLVQPKLSGIQLRTVVARISIVGVDIANKTVLVYLGDGKPYLLISWNMTLLTTKEWRNLVQTASAQSNATRA